MNLFFSFQGKKINKKKILFINTGQIGDLIVSSRILNKEFDAEEIYFLLRENYISLFNDYTGKIKFLSINYRRYKYSLLYRIQFLIFLRSYRFSHVYNLTAARTAINNEICLLSGAKYFYGFKNDWKYLINIFKKKYDTKYSQIIDNKVKNEYKKNQFIIDLLKAKTNNNISIFDVYNELPNIIRNKDYIAVAPFSSTRDHDWAIENYQKLIIKLNNNLILLLGSREQKKELQTIADGFQNVIVFAGDLSLKHIPNVISKCRLFIGLDSGLTHIALFVNTPTIAIIGGGNFNRFLPKPNQQKARYLYYKMPCFGCEWRCSEKVMECIENVSVDLVYENVQDLLKDTK